MEANHGQDERALQEALAKTRSRLDGLVDDLRGVDLELEALADERRRYQVLQQACGALVELEELGGARLFWGDAPVDGAARDHLQGVRSRVDDFHKHLGEIEDQRLAIVDQIESVQIDADDIEDDLDELRQREELRKLEWIVERDESPLPPRPTIMPWARGGEDDRRFRRTLAIALLACLLLGVLFPFIPLPVLEHWEAVEVPDRLTRLLQEEQPLPPPTQVAQPTRPDESRTEPTEEARPAEKKPSAAEPTKGILAFRDQFSELAASLPAARLGSQARIRNPGQAAAGRPQRSLVARQGAASSGGIDVSSLSRDVGAGGGGTIERVEIVRATSSIGGGGTSDRPLSNGPGPSRTDEEIQIVFDRHKAALYRLYNRELRKIPTLQGQMVLRITIEPDGSVSLCDLQSTDMKTPRLVSQVLSRVRTFDFGAKDGVPAITILYPIDFLPAT
ncbi:MAG: AgmX/PglI C-terminal domain-containing protein [Myxococcota bacterium]